MNHFSPAAPRAGDLAARMPLSEAMSLTARTDTEDARSALAASFATRAESYDRRGMIPAESLAEAGAAGLFSLTVPRRVGGSGAGLAEIVAIARQLGAADPSATLILAMTWLQHATITRYGRWPDDIYRIVTRLRDGA